MEILWIRISYAVRTYVESFFVKLCALKIVKYDRLSVSMQTKHCKYGEELEMCLHVREKSVNVTWYLHLLISTRFISNIWRGPSCYLKCVCLCHIRYMNAFTSGLVNGVVDSTIRFISCYFFNIAPLKLTIVICLLLYYEYCRSWGKVSDFWLRLCWFKYLVYPPGLTSKLDRMPLWFIRYLLGWLIHNAYLLSTWISELII